MTDVSSKPVADPPPRKQKRPRAIQACDFCRTKKYKCSGTWPCQHCEKYKVTCVFEAAESNAAGLYAASYVKSLEERVEKLNAALALTQFSPPRPSISPSGHNNGYEPDRGGSKGTSQDAAQRVREPSDEAAVEVADVNRHTQGIEFHGPTSSVAFLGSIQQKVRGGRGCEPSTTAHPPSLVDALHNPGFSPQDNYAQTSSALPSSFMDHAFFSPRASMFLDAYFSNLHFIHPMVDRESVYKRSEELWKSPPEDISNSFVSLYLAIISLGALIRTWTEDNIMGMRRFDWSRNAFRRAAANLQKSGPKNDIETIQAHFVMTKICQNELNPSLAYIYLGQGIRLALSAGINRESRGNGNDPASKYKSAMASKTWWGIYSLEIELSFSLGRPDTLGDDLYHNVPMTPLDETETAMIPVMADFARIIRSVSMDIYLIRRTPMERLTRAFQIENDLVTWLNDLPPTLCPQLPGAPFRSNALRDPLYARLQRMVLQLRFYNVTMLLMRPFLLYSSQSDRQELDNLPLAVTKCITAAANTIEFIHNTFQAQIFFRTWWYNTTYCLFAASIILFALTQPPVEGWPVSTLSDLIEKSIEVLEAMGECVVAQKAAEMIRTTFAQVREGHQSHAAIEFIAKSLPVSPRLQPEIGTYEGFKDDFSLLLGGYDMIYDASGYAVPSNGAFWPNLDTGFEQG